MDEPNEHPNIRHRDDDKAMTTSPPWKMMPLDWPEKDETYYVAWDRMLARPFSATWYEDDSQWKEPDRGLAVPWYVAPYFRERTD